MLVLITGGASSGKSAWAEALLETFPGRKIYLATMLPADAESRKRIARHRESRAGKGFETVECYKDLARCSVCAGAGVLLEDLPNLLANECFSPGGRGAEAVREGLEALQEKCGTLIVVTGEVFSGGSGCVEETLSWLRELAALGRELAARADVVIETVCGLPNILKGRLPCTFPNPF